MTVSQRVQLILDHIQHVQRNCYKLGMRLIEAGELELGRNLIANGQIHDNSKFKGIEFDHLFRNDPLLGDVVTHHSSTNMHHPEYWGGIKKMPELYVAEMVCDWYARSAEFGTDLRVWIDTEATKKFEFTQDDEVYQIILKMLNILLEPKF